jgi:hypothetical protein
MTPEEFGRKFNLLKQITENGIRSFHAISAKGRVVMVHFLDGGVTGENRELLERLDQLDPGPREKVLEVTAVDESIVIVTKFIDGFESLPSWLGVGTAGEVTPHGAAPMSEPAAVPPADPPPAPGEFTRLFRAHVEDPATDDGDHADAAPDPAGTVPESRPAPAPSPSAPRTRPQTADGAVEFMPVLEPRPAASPAASPPGPQYGGSRLPHSDAAPDAYLERLHRSAPTPASDAPRVSPAPPAPAPRRDDTGILPPPLLPSAPPTVGGGASRPPVETPPAPPAPATDPVPHVEPMPNRPPRRVGPLAGLAVLVFLAIALSLLVLLAG